MKKVLLIVTLIVLLSGIVLASSWGQYQGHPIVRVIVDGRVIQGDVPAINLNGRTMVPLRFVSEALGATVSWDQETYTASIQHGLRYSWDLTAPEVLDAIAWGKACRRLGRSEVVLPYRYDEGGLAVEILTPWACVAVEVQTLYQQGQSAFNIEGLKRDYSGYLHVWVATANPLPTVTVQIVQVGQTFAPTHVFDPLPKAQEFVFNAYLLDKSLPIVVNVTLGGQTYSYTWDLGDLK
ncbi:MAG: copper amine oxidase N-terminal domain-containing protein [Actinobacteria bacterium]|nr:MAG: copper amine oxidase N-terminal domain-containing protein [Actinomycetota bacterium]